jgi:hypothetical protein
MDMELWGQVEQKVQESDISGAIHYLEVQLQGEKHDEFKGLIGITFANSPESVLDEINAFIRFCDKDFDIKAVYLEMNGFDINYDRWFFDFFGYSRYSDDPTDLDWLCDWQSGRWPYVELTGLEAIQENFAWYHEKRIWKNRDYERIYEIATLLVMVKYVSLIQTSLRSGDLIKPIPVLATAHDFDIIGRFLPHPG